MGNRRFKLVHGIVLLFILAVFGTNPGDISIVNPASGIPAKVNADSSLSVDAGIKKDNMTDAIITIDWAHHELHDGDHYFIEGYTTLGVGGTLYVKLVTPNTTKWSHFGWQIQSSGILLTTLVEAPTGGMTGGAGVTPINNNRNSSNSSGVVITSGVTAPTGGTIISKEYFGSKSAGGGVSREDEIILKQNTTYNRTFTSSTASNIVSFKAFWYEHDSN